MDGFQTTILGVAVVILILILAVVGLMMANNKANLLYPPSSLPCPNYWQLNSDGACVIPTKPVAGSGKTTVNIGTWSSSTPTAGYNQTTNSIDFKNNSWGAPGNSATCAKRKWARDLGILWDGVSNFNGC